MLIAGDHELVVAHGQAAAGPVGLHELARDANEVGARSGQQPGRDCRGSHAPAGGQLIPWPPGALRPAADCSDEGLLGDLLADSARPDKDPP